MRFKVVIGEHCIYYRLDNILTQITGENIVIIIGKKSKVGYTQTECKHSTKH